MQASTNQSELESSVDDDRILSQESSRDPEVVTSHLSARLPYVWAHLYKKRSPHSANIMRIVRNGFEYLFDFSSELVKQAALARIKLLKIGSSQFMDAQPQKKKGIDHLMRKHPLGPAGFIRTHSADACSTQTRRYRVAILSRPKIGLHFQTASLLSSNCRPIDIVTGARSIYTLGHLLDGRYSNSVARHGRHYR